jgi:cytochrome oxidase Cu insertion factor (SCO1/SenC/PrrC family)
MLQPKEHLPEKNNLTERTFRYMIKRFAAFTISLILLAGCTEKKSININGNLFNKDNNKIYLNRIDVDTYVGIDSASIKKNGNFRFRFKANEPDFYQIGFTSANFITILAEPGEKIILTFKGNKLYENYEVQGSPGSQKIKKLDLVLDDTKRKIDSLKLVYDKASKNPGFDKQEPLLNEEYFKLVKEQRNKNIEFLIGNLNSFASIKALYQRIDEQTFVLYDQRDLQFFKLVSDSLNYHYPNSKQARALKKNFEKEMNQMFMNQIEQAARNLPESKLDPNLKDIYGTRIALSSLKGKVVLLTFWATSSQDCVEENFTLKEFYKIYKPKGFEIYQVNLDENDAAWKKAIKFDELPWISVREDDPLNQVNARLYNVKALPANYLYDKNGNIIGMDLHGKQLQIKLAQLFGN